MKMKRKITFEVEMSSGASEADLFTHIGCFTEDIVSNVLDQRHHSWWKFIHSIFSDSTHPVDIEISSNISDNT
jgi:hypothetical protein